MKGLIHYQFANYFRTHKYIPPVSVFIMMLVINYTYVPNPILDSYSFTSLVLFFIMGWVTITILHAEDEGQKQITLMHAKNKRGYYLALVINCAVVGLLLSIVAVAYPVVIQAFTPGYHTIHLVIGLLAHFSFAVLSIALSLFFTRDLVKSSVNSWWGVISILIVSLILAVAKADILKIKALNWLFPPLRHPLENMSVGDKITSLHAEYYWQFGWIFIYSLILIALFIVVVQKRQKL
ncbi:ABC transporter permease [Rummeliibacillus pycnus]|uniref:ABC transporter permease n=1 Tax=Rummeliibacillus pycnus TaxID=101070 RepID=UPI0037C5C0CE